MAACDCSFDEAGIPLAILSLCVSFASLLASFFTHKRVLGMGQTMEGHRLYGKMEMMES